MHRFYRYGAPHGGLRPPVLRYDLKAILYIAKITSFKVTELYLPFPRESSWEGQKNVYMSRSRNIPSSGFVTAIINVIRYELEFGHIINISLKELSWFVLENQGEEIGKT